MQYTISSNQLTVVVDELGAEVISVTKQCQQRIWQNADGKWNGHAPILFPFCGHCRMIFDGTDYGDGFHGFARNLEFTCVEHTDSSVMLQLQHSTQTLERYPFEFQFRVKYTVAEHCLEIQYIVVNKSATVMPFACGGHESFALLSDVGNYKLLFDQDEQFNFLQHDASGFLNGAVIDCGRGKVLPFPQEYMKDNTIILHNINSRKVQLVEMQSDRVVAEVCFDGFPNLLLWHPAGSHMVCVEPWQNLPDNAQTVGEFSHKAGVNLLPPDSAVSFTRCVKYH